MPAPAHAETTIAGNPLAVRRKLSPEAILLSVSEDFSDAIIPQIGSCKSAGGAVCDGIPSRRAVGACQLLSDHDLSFEVGLVPAHLVGLEELEDFRSLHGLDDPIRQGALLLGLGGTRFDDGSDCAGLCEGLVAADRGMVK